MINNPNFQALRREYMEGVRERCQMLAEVTRQLESGSTADLKDLRQEVHKLRGSGGFYGFAQLSASAARAEDYLVGVLDGEVTLNLPDLAALIADLTAACDRALQEVGLAPAE